MHPRDAGWRSNSQDCETHALFGSMVSRQDLQPSGTPENPVPGRKSDRIPTDVFLPPEAGEEFEEDRDDGGDPDDNVDVGQTIPVSVPDTQAKPDEEMRQWYITRQMVRDYGATPGCPGCEAKGMKNNAAHSQECRMRMMEDMANDDKGRARLAREQARQAKLFERAIQRDVEANEELRERQRAHDDEAEGMEGTAVGGQADGPGGRADTDDVRFHTPVSPPRRTTTRKSHDEIEDEELLRPHVARTLEFDGEDGEAFRVANQRASASRDWPMTAEEGIECEDPRSLYGLTSGSNDAGYMDRLRRDVPINAVDIIETYSPPGVVPVAEKMGMTGGSGMDLTTQDSDGQYWDFP